MFNLQINRQVITDESVLREAQQLSVYLQYILYSVYMCVNCAYVGKFCACVYVRQRNPYFVRTSLEEVNSMEGNEKAAGCEMLIQ